ncbi:MAG: SPOR domain-containing protein [Candidatus Acidiferrales bacterium]
MASSGRRGGGERVLESRHLVGLFLGVVLLCGVFFTLGYVMGRQQYGGSVHAADAAPLRSAPPASTAASAKNKEAAPANGSTPGDQSWDFYPKGNGTANDHLDSAAPPRAKQPASSFAAKSEKPAPPVAAKALPASSKEPGRFQPPALNKNSIVLQVAAVKVQRDALEMADAIQQKRFPSFVATSPTDNLYHVQIGPYPDMAAAESAKRSLEQLGFKPIIKH